jgi:nucleotide-binding universal stress UspA family protein
MKPFLLATDGSPAAGEAAKTAIELAGALEAPLLVATIWDVAYEPIGVGFGPGLPDIDRVGHKEALRVADDAARLAAEAGLEVDTIVCRGHPVEQICAIADKRDPRMIVVGSHGWGALRRALFGSVSTGVIHRARQPVLVVRGVGSDRATHAAEREEAAV